MTSVPPEPVSAVCAILMGAALLSFIDAPRDGLRGDAAAKNCEGEDEQEIAGNSMALFAPAANAQSLEDSLHPFSQTQQQQPATTKKKRKKRRNNNSTVDLNPRPKRTYCGRGQAKLAAHLSPPRLIFPEQMPLNVPLSLRKLASMGQPSSMDAVRRVLSNSTYLRRLFINSEIQKVFPVSDFLYDDPLVALEEDEERERVEEDEFLSSCVSPESGDNAPRVRPVSADASTATTTAFPSPPSSAAVSAMMEMNKGTTETAVTATAETTTTTATEERQRQQQRQRHRTLPPPTFSSPNNNGHLPRYQIARILDPKGRQWRVSVQWTRQPLSGSSGGGSDSRKRKGKGGGKGDNNNSSSSSTSTSRLGPGVWQAKLTTGWETLCKVNGFRVGDAVWFSLYENVGGGGEEKKKGAAATTTTWNDGIIVISREGDDEGGNTAASGVPLVPASSVGVDGA